MPTKKVVNFLREKVHLPRENPGYAYDTVSYTHLTLPTIYSV